MSKIVKLICYWNGKVLNGKNDELYEGPPSTVRIIKSGFTFEEFMDKFYHMIGYGK